VSYDKHHTQTTNSNKQLTSIMRQDSLWSLVDTITI